MIRAAREAVDAALGWAFQAVLDLLYGKSKEQDDKESKS